MLIEGKAIIYSFTFIGIKMNIKKYLESLKSESNAIFETSIILEDHLGSSHHYVLCIHEFTENITDPKERKNWTNVCSQLEASILSVVLGLYRQAFTSLRLAFELGLGSILFSTDKIHFYEWLQGVSDIKWAKIIDEENGIFSQKYINAFCPLLKDDIKISRSQAIFHYRKLSEYVHGNHQTWIKDGIKLTYNNELIMEFFNHFEKVTEILLYSLFTRYSNDLESKTLETFEFLSERLGHNDYIREYLGGAKV